MLDFAMDTIVFICFGYVIFGFVIGLVDRWQHTLQTAAPAEIPTPATAPLHRNPCGIAARPQIEVVEAEPVEPVSETPPQMITHAIVPFRRNWSRKTTAQLRAACKERNIKWRNARTDGKHLRKQEMIYMLMLSEPYKPFAADRSEYLQADYFFSASGG